MNKKFWSSILGLSVLAAAQAHAQTPGLPFLNIGVGAAAQSMGGAYIAHSQDASATYWNPSALSMVDSSEVFFYHSQFVQDFSYNYASFAHPIGKNETAFGVSVAHFAKGEFEGRDEN